MVVSSMSLNALMDEAKSKPRQKWISPDFMTATTQPCEVDPQTLTQGSGMNEWAILSDVQGHETVFASQSLTRPSAPPVMAQLPNHWASKTAASCSSTILHLLTSAALLRLVSIALGAAVKVTWPIREPQTILAVPPSEVIAQADTSGVNSAFGLPIPSPARVPEASR